MLNGSDQDAPSSLVLAVGLGRGFGGKFTGLAELVWRARSQGRGSIFWPPGVVTSRVVPTPNGLGDVHVTSLMAGPHAARDSSETSDSHTFAGGAAYRFW